MQGLCPARRCFPCCAPEAVGTCEVYVMAIYDIGWTITGVSNQALAWLRSTAGKDIRVFEIGVWEESGTAAATVIGLGRPAAISATPTALTPQAQDTSSAAAGCSASVAATTKPTSPTTFMRRFGCPATLGSGIIWTYPRGLVVPTGPAELVVWNIGAATCVFGGYFSYDE